MTNKTLAVRLLERKKIPFVVQAYPDTERDAERIAELIGVPAGQVLKTLVVVRYPAKPMLVMIPANRQLNLKLLAKSVNEKKVSMASHAEAEQLTGLEVGGISALALHNKGFVIFLDRSACLNDEVYVSAGKKGLQLRLSIDDLRRVTGARIVDTSG